MSVTGGFCGTSAATPLAAGAVTQYLDLFGDADQATAALMDNATDLGDAGYDHDHGYGRVTQTCDASDGDGDGWQECEGDYLNADCSYYPGSEANGGYHFCTEDCPCEAAEGDCDTDSECVSGAFCATDVGADYGFVWYLDVCETCWSDDAGSEDYCSSACPCSTGEGDCDSDAECADGLVCADNVGSNYGFSWGVDVCQATCHSGDNGGYSYCTEACPCDAGGGDCDSDAECAAGSYCATDVGADYGFVWYLDVCEACFTQDVGTYDYCSTGCPCPSGEGDCDSDAECADGLVCADNVGQEYGWDWGVDVCQATCHRGDNGDYHYCSEACPCDAGEGDCDSDAECSAGNHCQDDVGASYGFTASIDVCEADGAE